MSCIKKRGSGLVVLVAVMLVSGLTVIPCTNEASGQDMKELAINFLENVAGIDMSSYSIEYFHVNTYTKESIWGYEGTTITLEFVQYRARINVAHEQGKIRSYNLYERYPDGFSEFKNISTNVDVYGNDLSDYAERVEIALEGYEQLLSVDNTELKNILSVARSSGERNVESGDWRLTIDTEYEFRGMSGFASLSWTQLVDGHSTSRGLNLKVSDTGIITSFIDNRIYHIVTTEINIYEDEAIEKARPYAEEYAEKYGSEITGVSARLAFTPDGRQFRSEDKLAIYPKWIVQFDFYGMSKSVTGYEVCMWADTGEVYRTVTTGYYSSSTPSPVPRSRDMAWNYIFPALLFIGISVSAVIYHKRIKNKCSEDRYVCGSKPGGGKNG